MITIKQFKIKERYYFDTQCFKKSIVEKYLINSSLTIIYF
jgi:hypothetical protein